MPFKVVKFIVSEFYLKRQNRLFILYLEERHKITYIYFLQLRERQAYHELNDISL